MEHIVLVVDGVVKPIVPNVGDTFSKKDKNNAFKWQTMLKKSGSDCSVVIGVPPLAIEAALSKAGVWPDYYERYLFKVANNTWTCRYKEECPEVYYGYFEDACKQLGIKFSYNM
ncbi:hypothetical protein [Vibrio phage RYC]|nr:hypothetical protein [Vibrio phage RYC]